MMEGSTKLLVLCLWWARRRIAPDGGRLERYSRPVRRVLRVWLGDVKPVPLPAPDAPAPSAPPSLPGPPLVSLLVLVDSQTDAALATETFDSVFAQTRACWELWIVSLGDDAGPAWQAARDCATRDVRVRTVQMAAGAGPAGALNHVLRFASGALVGVIGIGDRLAADALEIMLGARDLLTGTDILYSDEDSVDPHGVSGAATRKPSWSPHLILSYPYTGRFCLMRRELVLELGGWRAETFASEEYDLVLRAAAFGARIEYVGSVLYHRRRRRDGEPDVFGTPDAVAARRRALEEHLSARGLAAEIVDVAEPVRLRVRPTIVGRPLVSIIIPTRDKLNLLRQCIDSIEAKTLDQSYEIIIVDNDSVERETLSYFATCGHQIVPYPGAFNFAGEINAGARAARGDLLLFLNNDTEIVSPEWLTAMVEWGQQPSIGCVGARLLFDDGAYQHVGIVLRDGSAHHPYWGKKPGDGNRWTDTELIRDCAGVTAACLMVRREVFEELGGFDESFPINYNDIDFCIRVAEKGYRNLYTPYAALYHHESASRPPGVTDAEHEHLRARHPALLWNDPYWGVSVRPIGPLISARILAKVRPAEPRLVTSARQLRARARRGSRRAQDVIESAQWHEGISFYAIPPALRAEDADVTSGEVRWIEQVKIVGDPKISLFMHPPFSRRFLVKVQPHAAIRVSLALLPDVWNLNEGGVEFELSVSPLGGQPSVTRTWRVNPHENKEDRAWKTVCLDLAPFAGQSVEVCFHTTVPPGASSSHAWAVWGDPRLVTRQRRLDVLKKELLEVRARGPRSLVRRVRHIAAQGALAAPRSMYETWLAKHLPDEADLEWMRTHSDRFAYRPTISLITPVYNTDPTWLRALVDSVKRQAYPKWELCLCDDGSSKVETLRELERLNGCDPRIKIGRLPKNGGISAASNGALALATGEFVALLDHDDELTGNALYEVAKLLNAQPDADLIYTDEDKLEPDGSPSDPYFKPDWSPAYLRSTMYIGHLGVYRRSIVDAVGGFRSEFDGSQDYDLALRVSEKTHRVYHIPKILYRWRKIPGSAAASVEAKPWGFGASFRALADHASRLQPPARVEDIPGNGLARVRYPIVGDPLVSIIIPTDGRIIETAYGPRDLVLCCARSVVERTSGVRYELIIVDNGHLSAASEAFLATVPHRRITYSYEEPFNFAAKVNFAVSQARGEHIVLLNDDTEVISDEWVLSMLELSQQPDVGVVGAKLYFPDGRLQHVGVVIGIGGGACHIYWGENRDHPGYYGGAKVIREFSAVTGACVMTRRSVFNEVGGFDEAFRTDFNDIDYCLRARERGYRVVFTPVAELYHFEGASFGSRERIVNMHEVSLFASRWAAIIANDPYYSPHLTVTSLSGGLRV